MRISDAQELKEEALALLVIVISHTDFKHLINYVWLMIGLGLGIQPDTEQKQYIVSVNNNVLNSITNSQAKS